MLSLNSLSQSLSHGLVHYTDHSTIFSLCSELLQMLLVVLSFIHTIKNLLLNHTLEGNVLKLYNCETIFPDNYYVKFNFILYRNYLQSLFCFHFKVM